MMEERVEDLVLKKLLEPVRHPDVQIRLEEISKELKQMDGEHWAVGELVERARNVLLHEEQLA